MATPALLGDPWRMSSVSTLESQQLWWLESALLIPGTSSGCVRSGSRASGPVGGWPKGRCEVTHPHSGDSTAAARSRAGGSAQADSGGGNSSRGHSEGDTGVSPASKQPTAHFHCLPLSSPQTPSRLWGAALLLSL